MNINDEVINCKNEIVEYRKKLKESKDKLYEILKKGNIKTKDLEFNFYLTNYVGVNIRSVYCQNRKYIYTILKLNLGLPVKIIDIFNAAKPHVDKYIKEYKDFTFQRKPITNSCFKIILCYFDEYNETIKRKLYSIDIDNINDKVLCEYRNEDLLNSNELLSEFYVNIEVELYNQNKFFKYDGEKDPIITDKCIICKCNKPNLLITKCFHLCVCRDCNSYDLLTNCPRCDVPIAALHKVFFYSETKN